MICKECYSDKSRITPLLHPIECLTQHTQYICGTCGRCICIACDPQRGLQRWNFPFKSLEIAKLYLRTADISMHKACSIYEIKNEKGRCSYKIFESQDALLTYLKKYKDKQCIEQQPVYKNESFQLHKQTEIRRLTSKEVQSYMAQR